MSGFEVEIADMDLIQQVFDRQQGHMNAIRDYVSNHCTGSEGTGVGTILDDDTFDVLGSVTTPAGAGVGATHLTLTGNAQPSSTVVSDSSGSFEFDDLPDGRYTITPSATGSAFVPASATVDVRGGSTTGVVFYATTNPTISGRVTDSGGNPVGGVTVTRRGNGQTAAATTTNSAGYYVFSGSPAGNYTIVPSSPGATFTPPQQTVRQTATNAVTADFTRG